MRRGLYLAYYGEKNHLGLKKKIESQISALKFHNIDVKYKEVELDTHYGILKKILRRLPFTKFDPVRIAVENDNEYDFVYIRYFFSEVELPRFISKLKNSNSKIKVIIEFFDWPINTQKRRFFNFFLIKKEISSFKKISSKIDRVITYNGENDIFGIEALYTKLKVNGLDLDDIQIKKSSNSTESVNILAVSIMKKYHGYDRLLYGLREYVENNRSRKVHIHLVGDGPELKHYKKIVDNHNLGSYITFHGFKGTRELEEIYDYSDVAVASLGLYRIKINKGSFIKTSEYLAKGLPVISGCEVELFTLTNFDAYLEFANNNTSININEILTFYDGLLEKYVTKEKLTQHIRMFAQENCDIKYTLLPVVEFINK